jgi:hypothetical protein
MEPRYFFVIFASTMLYALARKLGLAPAAEEFMRQVRLVAEGLSNTSKGRPVVLAPLPGPVAYIPAAYTIARLALLDEIQINVNAGATVIAKARNIAAHSFLESPCEVWVTCDDDVEVSEGALATMVSQCQAEACIVIAPCLLRDTLTANISERAIKGVKSTAPNGGALERVASGGFGCVAMSRAALAAVEESRFRHRWTDDAGVDRSVMFRDEIHEGRWYTEDTAFFYQVPESIPVYSVRTGQTVHNGQILDLATLEALVPCHRAAD